MKIPNLIGSNISDIAKKIVIGYKFYIFVGPVSLAFNRISGIEKRYNYQAVQEGGVNDKLTFLRRPIDSPSTIVFEDGGLVVSYAKIKECFSGAPKEIFLILCSSSGDIRDILFIGDAVASRISISDLVADESKVVVNSIEMSYTGFTRVPWIF